jgi:hypothetical protein
LQRDLLPTIPTENLVLELRRHRRDAWEVVLLKGSDASTTPCANPEFVEFRLNLQVADSLAPERSNVDGTEFVSTSDFFATAVTFWRYLISYMNLSWAD